VRLTVLLAAPLTLTLAAALAFRPSGGGRAPQAAALILLLGLYGMAVAQHDPGAPVLAGTVLLLLLAAWLFPPRLRRRRALAAVGMVAAALAASLPLASGIASEEPVIDYRSWRWLGDPTRYDWNHSYGPIDWPRRGEEVLSVQSDRPHYWKTAALDHFDGLRWVRSTSGASAGRDPGIPPDAPERWETEVHVTVGALDSTLLVTPGSIQEVEGAGTVTFTRDGVARSAEEVEQGTTYAVRAYAPNPSVERMRAAPEPSPLEAGSATLVHLPPEGRADLDALESSETEPSPAGRAVTLPRYSDGLGASPGAEAYVAESAYAPVYSLARRLVDGAPTMYDAVRRVEAHLRAEYRYSERPPEREYPLVSFLFEDRAGYCQQFSGAMALMLRMNGIPARVATGFAPGQRDSDGDAFTVRDLDAHSWVEVHFVGIGWVPFDPTPAGAPTTSRADGTLASAARGDDGVPGVDLSETLGADAAPPGGPLPPAADLAGGDSPGSGSMNVFAILASAAALVLAAGGVVAGITARRRAGRTDWPVRELERALRQLGHSVAPGTTLMDLERRLAGTGRTAAARYVRRLREQRFGGGHRAVDPTARRALRSALTEGAGVTGKARGYLALPPRLAAVPRRR
jgi:protein-glutamine gamma-glutamyltransferase